MIKYLSVGPSWKDWENGYRTLITQSFKAQQKKQKGESVIFSCLHDVFKRCEKQTNGW